MLQLEDWWLHRGYLEYRPPLPVNISPGIVFPPMHYSDQEGQVRTAAALIIHILEFREMVNSGQLEPDNVKGRPQDMSQYLKVFGSYRVPGGTHDEILIGEENVQRPFMIVMHRNSVILPYLVFCLPRKFSPSFNQSSLATFLPNYLIFQIFHRNLWTIFCWDDIK